MRLPLMQGYGFKLFAVVALVLISLWQLFPTIQNALNDRELAAMSSDEREVYEKENYEDLLETRESSLNLGLDLQGGMHVALEIGTGALLQELAGNRADDTFERAIEIANERAQDGGSDFVTLFADAVEEVRPNTRLARYFRNTDAGITARSSNADVVTYLRSEVDEALGRAEEIIRQRIDRFGVTEPLIQRQDGSRIVVELPGVDDPQRVRDLLRGTAKLTFHLTPPTQELQQAALRVLQYYGEGGAETAATTDADTTGTAIDTTAAGERVAAAGDSAGAVDLAQVTGGEAPSASGNSLADALRLIQVPEGSPIFGQVVARDTATVRRLLEAPGAQALLPAGVRLLYTANPEGVTPEGEDVYNLIGINERVELTGDVITDAGPDFDPYTNAPQVSITMNGVGGQRWSQITGANIGRPVALVLDNRVYSDPVIQSRIPNGRTQITGQFSRQDVEDIVTVLKSGALPAPVRIVEERTVGPSLGAASIRAGTRALIVGFLVVGVFMAFYYRGAGLIANIALVLNLLFIFGVLASFSATLTLPGMAGIVLTIGMAVDANVLIFERIREELDSGKTMRAAVDGGFAKALSAIADANITTFLIGVILFSFGVGPIQGFAVTLMAGILTSLFTALVVTRLVLDYLVQSRGTRVAFG
ncbi:protein translocase subunit SecD [Rubrivirga sp. S365]|uniref:Protein translocase subunit SecD n=1 Tax=Rubrivirga litoralis TaxID=3075598 RepID=A0ABU3BVA2_9BACT|nr:MULTISPECIES: protein translocase subunit SecD [unclassified Rubrivirga]MDT0633228.1 protein translocase subunit SecD [Rubrivirga sp. F394]MDT7856886.1 protein translocase subunit SecD [Rubrivirga sp. S365]